MPLLNNPPIHLNSSLPVLLCLHFRITDDVKTALIRSSANYCSDGKGLKETIISVKLTSLENAYSVGVFFLIRIFNSRN